MYTSCCELLTHPGHKAEDDLHRDAPSQAGKPKSTENGEQAQPVRKGDPLFAARLLVQANNTGEDENVLFAKREKRVLVNGRGFRYRLRTGDLTSTGTAGQFRLVPAALEQIQAKLYAQG